MQDIHAIGGVTAAAGGGGGAGKLFGGGSGGGDRRLRPHGVPNHQALKCPRCDSLNTKFCYYNNYNLSQPRYFCKSCRRYWTKGGVLRNVPVGGGCRKAKRSKPKQSGSPSETTVAAAAREGDSNSHSSSESSSLTATTTVVEGAKNSTNLDPARLEVGSVTANSPSHMMNFQQSGFFIPNSNATSSGYDQQQHPSSIAHMVSSDGQMFPEIGSFTSLMTTPGESSSLLGYNMANMATYQMQQNEQGCVQEDRGRNPMIGEEMEQQMNCGFLDQAAGFSSLQQQSRAGMGTGLAGVDWQISGEGGGSGDQGLFDFGGADDDDDHHQSYLAQHHWSDHDLSLNFPPLV